MKKYVCILLGMLLCICLGGCSGSAHKDVSSVHKGEESEKAGQFYGKTIVLTSMRTRHEMTECQETETYQEIDEHERSIDVITSWKEWVSLSESLSEEERSKCSYDKAFFEDKDLLLVSFVSDRSYRYALKQMELTGERLRLTITQKAERFPGFSLYAREDILILQKRRLLIEADKGSVPKDADITITMEEGFYDQRVGYIRGIQKQAEQMTLEFEEAEWGSDETQPDQSSYVSKNEAAQIYYFGEDVRYIVYASGVDDYNQTHDKKLEGKVSASGEIIDLEETAFLKYVDYLNQSDQKESAVFWITIDEGQVVMVREAGIE